MAGYLSLPNDLGMLFHNLSLRPRRLLESARYRILVSYPRQHIHAIRENCGLLVLSS